MIKYYFYATEESEVKKVLNFLEENKIKYKIATFNEANKVLSFTKLHVIQVFLNDADVDKYIIDLANLRQQMRHVNFI